MNWHEKHSQRARSLQRGEALNVTSTDEEGRNIRKVKVSERSRSLVPVPGHPDHVVNVEKEKDGLVNFLRLQGYKKRDMERILKELERIKGLRIKSPRRYRYEDREDGDTTLSQKHIVNKRHDYHPVEIAVPPNISTSVPQ